MEYSYHYTVIIILCIPLSVNYNLYHYGGENDTAYYIQTPAVSVEEKNKEQVSFNKKRHEDASHLVKYF